LYTYGPTNSGIIFDGPPLINPFVCALTGSQTALPIKQLQTLYGSKAGYVSKYSAAANAAVRAGYIAQEDANEGIAAANALPLP
jgi:hypothetical protein